MIKNSILILGPSGSGKTFYAKQIAPPDEEHTLFISLNSNSHYESLVHGIGLATNQNKLCYKETEQIVLSFLRKTEGNPGEEFYLILDDIHRSDLTYSLGELIYAFRNRNSPISLKNGAQITAGDNVKLIGTCVTGIAGDESIKNSMSLFDEIKYMQNDLIFYQSVLQKNGLQSTDPLWTELTSLYDDYTQKYCVFTPEYKAHEYEYRPGCALFMPAFHLQKDCWLQSVQHKIRHQVLPLLSMYAENGIIKKEFIPHVNKTDTEYVIGPIAEEHIAIKFVKPKPKKKGVTIDEGPYYFNWEITCFDPNIKFPLPTDTKSPNNSSHPVNWLYVVAMPIIRDMIEYSLINHHDLMDIFLYDNEVLCFGSSKTTTAPNGQDIASLFVDARFVEYFPSNDHAKGNKGGYMYRNNLYKFSYNSHTYFMFSAYENSTLPYEIKDCIIDPSKVYTGQKRPLFPTLKMLVYKYLCKYRENLLMYRKDHLNYGNLQQLEDDIEFVKSMTTDPQYKGKPFYFSSLDGQNAAEFVFKVRDLPTWQMMKQNKYNGVYRIMSSDYKNIMDATNVKQMIFQGPPGTSKTFSAKKFISEQLGIIAPDWEKKLEDYHLMTQNDTYVKPQPGQPAYWDIIQFHPSYTYEDFVRGIAVFQNDSAVTGSIKGSGGVNYDLTIDTANSIGYKSVNKALAKIAGLAAEDYQDAVNNSSLNTCPNYYLIIDEINRANLAVVFGELIYALEYRGENGKIKTPYSVNGSDTLYLPPNLYIIGTMNTADKSIGSIDYAIRRRFLFFKLLPDVNVISDTITSTDPNAVLHDCTEIKLFYLIDLIFNICLNEYDYQKEDVQLGHTYFLRKSSDPAEIEEQAKCKFLYQVVPIISEYVKDGVLDITRTSDNNDENDILGAFAALLNGKDSDKDALYDALLAQLSGPAAIRLIDEFC